jgi:hypothetical protein
MGEDAVELRGTLLAQLLAASLLGFVLLLPPGELLLALLGLALLLGLIILSALLGFAVGLFGLRRVFGLVFACGLHDGRGFCDLALGGGWIVHRALVVGADGEQPSDPFSVDDDGGFRRGARWLGVRVLRFDLAEMSARHGSRTLVFRAPPAFLYLHELGLRCDRAVNKIGNLDRVAFRVKALVRHRIRKEQRVVSAAARAACAGSGGGVKGCVVAIKRSVRER